MVDITIVINVLIGAAGGIIYHFIMKKIHKKENHPVYYKTIKSIWDKKVITTCWVDGILFCIPLLFFVLCNLGLISMTLVLGFSMLFIIIASIIFCAILLPLLRKWSIGTIKIGDEYIELFDSKTNKRTGFKWTDIEWIFVGESEKNLLRVFVDNRLIEINGISNPNQIAEIFQQKYSAK